MGQIQRVEREPSTGQQNVLLILGIIALLIHGKHKLHQRHNVLVTGLTWR